MKVELIKRTATGNIYGVYEDSGRPVGQVDWIMAGPNVGIEYYSLTSDYPRYKIRKIFRACYYKT